MSEVRVNNIVDYGGKGAPTFDNGAVISGISSLGDQAKIGSNVTITSGGINVSGVTTAATLSGNLTGDVNTGFVTATSAVIGSGVTINAGGLNITGVVTATTFEGDGSSMTGVAMTIAPLVYNPDPSDSIVTKATGIGITFDHRILAGSGNITLSVATNAGAAGTTVENFGVGSSVTIAGRSASIDPTSDLTAGETYHISYPSGAFTNTGGDVSYVGTAYTFGVKPEFRELWVWGSNQYFSQSAGSLGQNNVVNYSSPVQIPGTNWKNLAYVNSNIALGGRVTKTDGTLWAWGVNDYGQLGQNTTSASYPSGFAGAISSPVQVPGTTWAIGAGGRAVAYTKTDGTLWMWGSNSYGQLGQNSTVQYSSPVQIPGTTWPTSNSDGIKLLAGGADSFTVVTIKTDGTLWVWGDNSYGVLGQNEAWSPSKKARSSPVQIPGTTWKSVNFNNRNINAIKTDGSLWGVGYNGHGSLGMNNTTQYSSPIQVPGVTTWDIVWGADEMTYAVRTDGTLWTWGNNESGSLGQNQSGGNTSSPVQVPGTTWSSTPMQGGAAQSKQGSVAMKTDGTLWRWGNNNKGALGQNDTVNRSSPVQVGSDTNWVQAQIGTVGETYAIKQL